MNDLKKLNTKTIKGIRKNWPKHFPDEHKPPIDGIVISVGIPDNDLATKDIIIMAPDGTGWNIRMCGDEVIEYGIKISDTNAVKAFFNQTPADLSHLAQWGPKLLESEEPKKVVNRRIILD